MSQVRSYVYVLRTRRSVDLFSMGFPSHLTFRRETERETFRDTAASDANLITQQLMYQDN